MRKLLLVLWMAAFLVGQSTALLTASDFAREEQNALKLRHKAERKDLELKHKFWKQSLKDQPLPKAERERMKHQMEREKRELRERQKDELQDLKDRRNIAEESLKQL
jgi:hypothetical protein